MTDKLRERDEDAERYLAVKKLSREMLLLWRGVFGMSDAAIDDCISKNIFDGATSLIAEYAIYAKEPK